MTYKKTFSKNRRNRSRKVRPQNNLLKNNTFNNKRTKNNFKKSDCLLNNHDLLSAKKIFSLLFITGIALIAIYHRSILIYWQQTYHSDLFNSGGVTQDFIKEDSDEAIDEILLGSQATIIDHDDNVEDTNIHLIKDILIIPQPDIVKKNQTNKPENNQASLLTDLETPKIPKHDIPLIHEPLPIVLTENDKVFFAGDSLMQGVAPYVKKMLFKQYKIESIDLSKQSTGLAYPKAFNWPKTISDNLITDPSIKLLVVFLGPNDPWDFPVKGYPKYVKFKSPIWEEEYRLRIAAILNSAYEHDVQVLWLAAPCMRKPKLNDGMVYLNMLYQSEIEKVQQHFLTTNQLLGCTYENFTSFVESDKGKIKVRVDDGVHFTSTGQKILATAIMEKIIFKQLEDNDSD